MITPEELNTLDTLAKRLYSAKVFPRTVESVDMAFAILLAGHELGFSPMASARGITLVSGKVSLGADFTVAACTKHRDVCRYFSIIESNATQATYETHREGAPKPVALTYTFDMAKRAGLTGSQTWRSHPEAMLRARCAAALARSTYPDLVGGCYDPDEAAEIRGDHAREMPVAPAQEPTQRRANPMEGIGIEAPPKRPQNAEGTPSETVNPVPTQPDPAWLVALDTIANETPALVAFCNDVEKATIPSECGDAFRKHRATLAALPADVRESAWKALCERCVDAGQKGAKAWLKRYIAEADAKAAQTDAPAATEAP